MYIREREREREREGLIICLLIYMNIYCVGFYKWTAEFLVSMGVWSVELRMPCLLHIFEIIFQHLRYWGSLHNLSMLNMGLKDTFDNEEAYLHMTISLIGKFWEVVRGGIRDRSVGKASCTSFALAFITWGYITP